jgi:DNA-directed RNA polymerase specialized sigma24 family protein
MANATRVQAFYSLWFPTVFSFARLYLGNDDLAAEAAVDTFCEYMHTGLPYETDEMPLVLWECAIEVTQRHHISPNTMSRASDFENVILRLDPEERLVFLLGAFFDLPTGWISLITGWPLARIQALTSSSSARMRNLLGFPTSTPSAMISQFAALHRTESRQAQPVHNLGSR